VTLITYGAQLYTALEAADRLAEDGIDVEVIDLRTLRPLDDATILASVARTHRVVVLEEAWRTLGLGAELSARITEEAFYDLDAPVLRVASAEVPIPYAQHMEQAALPSSRST
jgi:pyruvate dehydrogenase E1 component beta subunit